ncbi:MAG: YIP1 family protein, partial [Verrucomicrobiae bacterium]|nr:YIP1 family protein [Verrucomicrobiae bacterium]
QVALVKKYSFNEALLYETAQLVLLLAAVFIAAWVIKSVGNTFFGHRTYAQAFTVTAYGLSPWFVLRFADALPGTQPWLTWGIGAVLAVAVLYHGVPRVMHTLPPHTFGLYLMCVVSLVGVTGLLRFLTAWYLEGRCKPVERIVEQLAAQLPF